MVLPLRSSLSLLALFLAFTNVSIAAVTSPVTWQSTLDPKSPLGQTLNGMFGNTTYETRATTPTGHPVTRYTKRPTPMPPATVGRMLGSAARRATPVGLALLAAGEIYDLVYNEDTDTWGSPNDTSVPDLSVISNSGHPLGAPFCSLVPLGSYYFGTNGTWVYTYTHTSAGSSSPGPGFGLTNYCQPGTTRGWTRQTRVADWPEALPETFTDTTPQEIVNLLPNTILYDIVSESVSSGDWTTDWPEAVTDATTINDSLENELEGATNPNPDASVTASASALPPSPSASGGGNMALEFPNFCTWTVVVCPFIDWVSSVPDAPEQPDLPELEIELEDYTSSIGSGSCPANIPFSLTFPVAQTFELDLVPICDLATDIKPFTLMSAYLLSAFILIGAIRR